ncbi:MAG TPA: sn-glycerol-3-phosphate ABC transporter ATP-binding protein UgpC [Gemmatimonadaceae bacterium]|nr:sn-glycerol-3-phosphate ABC transporter ATP-binding protein UgpC [Gemmatimonadaceae bacterium]
MSSPADRAASVELRGVRKEYENGVVAVHETDLTVAAGEFVVLVGPSGCGKSTTLRMVAGLESISAGELSIGGRIVNDVPPAERDIAMVFQSYALYPHMTVRDNMAFALRLRKRSAAEIAERVNAAAATLGLTAMLDRTPKQLSGGQRQRVAIGRAIVREPSVFLFDEPLSNLDAALRGEMRREIAALHHRLAATMIYVTHDQVEAMTLGDRIVVMNEGRIVQAGTPSEIYLHPRDVFVAGFIGSPPMNLLRGRIARNGDAMRVHLDAADNAVVALTLAAAAAVERSGAVEVVVGLRPEDIRPAADHTSADPSHSALIGTIELVEPLGHEHLLYLRVGTTSITTRMAARDKAAVGTRLRLHVDPATVHLFDARTGAAVG